MSGRAQLLLARYRGGAELLLACRRFTSDALLIAADAFREYERELRFEKQHDAADEARDLAERLRSEAPRRRRRCCYPPGQDWPTPGEIATPTVCLTDPATPFMVEIDTAHAMRVTGGASCAI